MILGVIKNGNHGYAPGKKLVNPGSSPPGADDGVLYLYTETTTRYRAIDSSPFRLPKA